MFRKIGLVALILAVCTCFGAPEVVNAGQNVTVQIDGNTVQFPDQKPFIDGNNRTMVPVRAPMEAMGCTVSWNQSAQQATITKGGINVVFTIGSSKFTINREPRWMNTVPVVVNDRTVFPIRYCAEAFGAKVDWNQAGLVVAINTNPGTDYSNPTQLPVKSDPKLKEVYQRLESNGYKVKLDTQTGYINDYGYFDIYINRYDANKQQFDKDVCAQAEVWAGKEAADWLQNNLKICEEIPQYYVWNHAEVFGNNIISTVMEENGDIRVSFEVK